MRKQWQQNSLKKSKIWFKSIILEQIFCFQYKKITKQNHRKKESFLWQMWKNNGLIGRNSIGRNSNSQKSQQKWKWQKNLAL